MTNRLYFWHCSMQESTCQALFLRKVARAGMRVIITGWALRRLMGPNKPAGRNVIEVERSS